MNGLPVMAQNLYIRNGYCVNSTTTEGFFEFYTWHLFPYVTPFVYPIGLITQSSSVYLTLCVTIERYVAVCSPLRAR